MPTHPEDPSPAGKSILVVDDQDDGRASLAMLLELAGHAVRQARHGQEALDLLRAGPAPDLILLDLVMPVMNGWEFRRLQRQDPALAPIPVVVLSAWGEAAEKADILGDVGYLQKPVDPGLLPDVIERHARPCRPEILVVEDEVAILMMLEKALRHYGFTAHLAAGCAEAVATYLRHRATIALALLDVQMGPQDGPQTLAALRQIEPTLPAVFMSGHTGRYTGAELLELGAAHVLEKPFRSLKEVAAVLWPLATQPRKR